jgi:DNA-binding Xre family transcriptional regulator
MTRRISEMLEENATKRYNQFMKENKAIAQRISLGDLASYLGITQQSLSRIRAAGK